MDSSWYWYPLPVARHGRRPDRPRPGRDVDARRAVHRRRRARRDAPAVRPRVHEGDARPRADPARTSRGSGCSTRARSWAPTASGCRSRGATSRTPTSSCRSYGADTVRLFLMFMGPWDQGGPWSPTGIGGVHRFLNRVWALALDPHYREPGDPDAGTLPDGQDEAAARAELRAAAHRTLRDVTADYEAFHFNTMVAKLMELSNTLFRYRGSVGRRRPGVGRGGPAAAADAGAGGAAHHRGAVVAPAGGRAARSGARSTPRRGPWWIARPWRSRPARCRSRSTARSATGSSCRRAPTRRRSRPPCWRRPRIQQLLAGRAPDRDHPRRRRPAREPRRPGLDARAAGQAADAGTRTSPATRPRSRPRRGRSRRSSARSCRTSSSSTTRATACSRSGGR